jgi:hypothetical protein
MKQIKTIVISLFLIILFSCETKSKKTLKTNKPDQVEVLDFYGKHRCKACISIEEKTKLTIETHFNEEVNKGILSFKVINIDEKENETITESYGAFGTSLFLNVIKDGKETHIDITDFAFKKENNQAVFIDELKLIIKNELNKL